MKFGLEVHKDELDQLAAGAKMVLAAACTQRHAVNYHTFAGGRRSRRSKQFDAINEHIASQNPNDRAEGCDVAAFSLGQARKYQSDWP